MSEFTTRPAAESDIPNWCEMRAQLWPGYLHHEHDVQNYFQNLDDNRIAIMAVATTAPDSALGFIELSLRQNIPATKDDVYTYIEGWFVSEMIRHAGAGKALIAAAEHWAREHSCSEMASECEIKNQNSASAHLACGFSEEPRNIRFRKNL
ncbi:MAG: GNAT family N-acetyltransferase [Verrucomicrobiota bacterium]